MKYLLASLLFLCSCAGKQEDLVKPVVQNITESVYASGTIKSRNQYEVFATVNGIISQQLVAEGDKIHKGDPIVTLVDETPTLNTENARLSATYSSVPYNMDKLNEAKINVDLSLRKMRNDSALFQRRQNLWKEGIGTRNELEQSELTWKSSTTAYQAALLQYNNLMKQVDFAAQQSLKNWQIARSVKSDYTVTARQDGKVYKILKEPGELVTIQTPVAVMGDENDFILELQVDEFDIAKIRPGQKVFVSMDSYQGQAFEATVTKIQPIMDERSRSFEVEAVFTSPPPHLYPNLTVETNILISTKENALTIPRSYLLGENMVLLKNGEKRKVVTGLKDYQRVEVISGLHKDDLIRKPEE